MLAVSPVCSTSETDLHDTAEILLKMALSIITPLPYNKYITLTPFGFKPVEDEDLFLPLSSSQSIIYSYMSYHRISIEHHFVNISKIACALVGQEAVTRPELPSSTLPTQNCSDDSSCSIFRFLCQLFYLSFCLFFLFSVVRFPFLSSNFFRHTMTTCYVLLCCCTNIG